MRRLVRIIALTVAVLGLVFGVVLPATATEAGTVEFTGSMDVGPGIGNKCIPTSVGTPKCPPNDLGAWATDSSTDFNNSATISSFSPATCVGEATTAQKPKPPASGPVCGFAGSGAIHGYCSLNEGHLSGVLIIGGSLGDKAYSFHLSFKTIGTKWTPTGTITNHATGRSGSITGADGHIFPTGGSCLSKDAKTFTVTGTLEFTIMNL